MDTPQFAPAGPLNLCLTSRVLCRHGVNSNTPKHMVLWLQVPICVCGVLGLLLISVAIVLSVCLNISQYLVKVSKFPLNRPKTEYFQIFSLIILLLFHARLSLPSQLKALLSEPRIRNEINAACCTRRHFMFEPLLTGKLPAESLWVSFLVYFSIYSVILSVL